MNWLNGSYLGIWSQTAKTKLKQVRKFIELNCAALVD
jgi:hypothetical protein